MVYYFEKLMFFSIFFFFFEWCLVDFVGMLTMMLHVRAICSSSKSRPLQFFFIFLFLDRESPAILLYMQWKRYNIILCFLLYSFQSYQSKYSVFRSNSMWRNVEKKIICSELLTKQLSNIILGSFFYVLISFHLHWKINKNKIHVKRGKHLQRQ